LLNLLHRGSHTHIKILIYHYTYSSQNLPKSFTS